LSPIVKERVKGVVSIGEAAPIIEESFSPLVEVKRAESMDEAVRLAFSMASSGDVVLLSPGCASFDMFKNYADRGEAFRRAVRKLEEEVG
ncbi:MAG: UDP-N-acetylmuramoyl-L-alanine--D-glutamate ligase, partial [Desulfurobacteriaceae bacterium]